MDLVFFGFSEKIRIIISLESKIVYGARELSAESISVENRKIIKVRSYKMPIYDIDEYALNKVKLKYITMDWEKVKRVRHRIKTGDYVHPEFLKSAIETDFERFYDRLRRDIDEGQKLSKEEARERVKEDILLALRDLRTHSKAKGSTYRNIVADILGFSLGELVDLQLMRREFKCKGGRGDLELPLRIENISKFPLWERWCDTYKITSIIVEVKNKKSLATPQDVAQILCYVVTANLGKFGILVSHHGFRQSAINRLRAISSTNQFLILPFDQKDIEYLMTEHACGPDKSMELFRQKATLLAQ